MKMVELGNTKEKIPIIGYGTWGIEKDKDKQYYENWKAAMKKSIELGITHIDTAEIYGNGAAESTIGQLWDEGVNRDDLFITSKLFPTHWSFKSMENATNASLLRLGIKNFDLYLIHWPSWVPISRFMKHFDKLLEEGKTRYVGVSNYFPFQVKMANNALKKGEIVTNQLRLNVKYQKPIKKSLDFYIEKGITITAYSPLAHGGLNNLKGKLLEKLEALAKKHDATIQQIALAWLINHDRVITIPKAVKIAHVEANAAAADIKLSEDELKSLY